MLFHKTTKTTNKNTNTTTKPKNPTNHTHQIKQFIMCLLQVWRYVKATKHDSVNWNLSWEVGTKKWTRLTVLISNCFYIILFCWTWQWPFQYLMQRMHLFLPPFHVNLTCSNLELLTSKKDSQIIWKYNVITENPTEVFNIYTLGR